MAMRIKSRLTFWKKLRATLRDTFILLHQFQWPLLTFVLVISIGAAIYAQINNAAGIPPSLSFPEAAYQVLGLVFLQPLLDFPPFWPLQLFYFIMPIIGIGILAQGVADFGVLFFNRRARSKEWEMAIAASLEDHIILIGLGHLGYRVVQYLANMDQDIVVIEANPDIDLITDIRSAGIPVIEGDGLREATLNAANIEKARVLIMCMQNDTTNLQISLKAHNLNPKIEVIMRIFDDEFAAGLEKQFGFRAFSATSMAAPVFAAAAAGVDMTRPITLDGQPLCLARLHLEENGKLVGENVHKIEAVYHVSVVLVRRDSNSEFHPAADLLLHPGDHIAILGGPAEITHLSQANSTDRIVL
jgi:voltage-gated potassium channel